VGVFGFKYSPRPYTAALELGDDVPEADKDRRLAALFELSESIRGRHLSGRVGQVERVLVEGQGADGAYSGRTERNEIVHFGCVTNPIGQLTPVRIERALKHSLVGIHADPNLAVPYEVVAPRRGLPVLA
jgi:tRNA-2-methylthio-N6-dimethylallyladenosine synthase